ncbi:Signal recognition particle receptor subunit beta [Armadillidium nasatum]|uniref:Signal recognition particle receptor subunit beta n=1 Tax=Armadillidium nasatum TaxID=96803 RepID=A0A5N5SL91_9CRUS|nr:Signal recognition particle receptor subunit beta [Armadillidium nasatum]KAB7506341.1 Signal recognition particle receptor subunit beta [Armadillidium nasatum]
MDTKTKTRISIKQIIKDLIPDINYQLLFTFILGLVVLYVVFFKLLKTKTSKNVIALLGLCGSGKTQLFYQLCHGIDVLSVTSVKESSHSLSISDSRKVTVYDIPGHDRIRYSLFDKIKSQLKALIFVIDASAIQEEIKDVAEFLYTILCDGSVQGCKPNILIVCNKQDIPFAKGASLIKSSLEKEMNLLRVTKSNQLKSVGTGENNNSFLGYQGQDFEFNQLKSFKISFVDAVASKGEQIDSIKNWLKTI